MTAMPPDEVMTEPPRPVQVRMAMSTEAAAAAQAELVGGGDHQRLLDQLWLRSGLIEQRRRTPIAERSHFDARANRILARLQEAHGDA